MGRIALALAMLLVTRCLLASEPFVVRVVDDATQRGVPLVELKTTHNVRYFTDNAGIVAIDDAALMDRDVFFFVASHGYEFPKDGFGYRGARFRVEAGKTRELKIKRLNIAERLYRITGAGLYEHALRAGQKAPIREPTLNAEVAGCDAAQTAIFRGKLFWTWGDTNRLRYPLGNFQSTAATSQLPKDSGLDPAIGINFDYLTGKEGFVREIAPIPGEGPTWLTALVTVKDDKSQEHLLATYYKVKPPLTIYERGLCEFDPKEERFKKLFAFGKTAPVVPTGHAVRRMQDGHAWLYFGEAVPHMRVMDRYESMTQPREYEAVHADVRFSDAAGGRPIKNHHGAVEWNPYRKKWISIFTQEGGDTSYLGEIWCAEADAPEGPWRKAVKVVTHDRYSFYNPKQHPYFGGEGRYVYFEGTYSTMFSGNKDPTPLYDYNQIMYRLDLADERLKPAE